MEPLPSNWDKMTKEQRTAWLASWFDGSYAEHRRVGDMERDKAAKALKKSRKIPTRFCRRRKK